MKRKKDKSSISASRKKLLHQDRDEATEGETGKEEKDKGSPTSTTTRRLQLKQLKMRENNTIATVPSCSNNIDYAKSFKNIKEMMPQFSSG